MGELTFLFGKYLAEAAFLCFCAAYAAKRNARTAFRLTAQLWWLLPPVAAAEVLGNVVFPVVTFNIRYVLVNYALVTLFLRVRVKERHNLAQVANTYILLSGQLIQVLATAVVYCIPAMASTVGAFGAAERFVSTAIIWTASAAAAWLILRRLRRIFDFEKRERVHTNLSAWVLFGAMQVVFLSFVQWHYLAAIFLLLLLLIETLLSLESSITTVCLRQENAELASISRQAALQLQHAEDVQQLYGELREMRHEMRNRFYYMDALLSQGKTAELSDYVHQQMGGALLPALQTCDSGNALVNAILWSKQAQMQREGIAFQVDAALPETLDVKGQHLCSLLANLLDNAIEASAAVKEAPEIRLTLRLQKKYLYCCVKNRVDYDVLARNPELKTTKADALAHGYGIRHIRRITELYNGMTEFAVEDGWFTATLMLTCGQGGEKTN